jgi:hypothetical protein
MGRKWSIVLATVLYTIGAALEAGSINFGEIARHVIVKLH